MRQYNIISVLFSPSLPPSPAYHHFRWQETPLSPSSASQSQDVQDPPAEDLDSDLAALSNEVASPEVAINVEEEPKQMMRTGSSRLKGAGRLVGNAMTATRRKSGLAENLEEDDALVVPVPSSVAHLLRSPGTKSSGSKWGSVQKAASQRVFAPRTRKYNLMRRIETMFSAQERADSMQKLFER